MEEEPRISIFRTEQKNRRTDEQQISNVEVYSTLLHYSKFLVPLFFCSILNSKFLVPLSPDQNHLRPNFVAISIKRNYEVISRGMPRHIDLDPRIG